MDTRQIIRRLLWREGRENALFLLAGVLLPVFILVLRTDLLDWNRQRILTMMVLMLLSLLVSLWAISRGNAVRRRSSFDFRHLPLAPRLDAAVSFLLPAAIATLIGAGIGFWGSLVICCLHVDGGFIWLGVTCMVANFTSCYLLSATTTLLPAVLLAAVWIVPTGMIYAFIPYSYLCSFSPLFRPPLYLIIAQLVYFIPSIALGALGGMCVFTALTQRTPSLSARVLAVLLLCALPLGLFVKEQCAPRKTVEEQMVTMLQDAALRLSLRYHAQSTTLEFIDHRADYHTTRDFAGRVVPCARDSRGDVLLLQQFPREVNVRLLCWTPRTGLLREEAGIPAGRGALQGYRYQLASCGSLSPDNRYLLLSLKSQLGFISDLWLLDRRQGRARLLQPDSGYGIAANVRWCGKQAFYNGIENDPVHQPGHTACQTHELADAQGGALMRQLLWKEWRERRLWLLGWGASHHRPYRLGRLPLLLRRMGDRHELGIPLADHHRDVFRQRCL